MSSLILAAVERGKADGLMRSAKKAGSRGGTIVTARSVTSNSLLCVLGLGERSRELLVMMVDEDQYQPVWDAVVDSKHFSRGVASSFNASWDASSSSKAIEEREWDLLGVICNHGSSDDVLATIRKTASVGALVIEGRGTARGGDIPFFWAHLVAEKEVVLSFVPAARTASVVEALEQEKHLQRAGSGVAFSLPVKEIVSKIQRKRSLS